METLSQTDSESEAYLKAIRLQQLRLAQKRLDLLKGDLLPHYQPHPKQDQFHQAGATFRRRMFRAGNRSGKSYMGAAEDCAWLRGERPWYPLNHVARIGGIPRHPVRGLVITTDWDKVDEIWTTQRGDTANRGKIWKFLPEGFVKSVHRNHVGAVDQIECHNGSMLCFDTVRSWMSNPLGSESSDWDFVHVDEPCPEGMFKAVSRGLMDRRGSVWFTLTPLREPWINDFFFPEDTGGKLRDDVWAVDGSTYDNVFLSPDAIKDYESTLSAEEIQCRIHGIPLHLSGLVYKEFTQSHILSSLPEGWKSFAEPPCEPPKDWPVYYYIDPHPQTPHCVLFLTVSPAGTFYVYRDFYKHCTIKELAEEIKAITKGYRVVRARIDPLAFINDPCTDSNMAMDLITHGVFVEKAVKDPGRGIMRVKEALKSKALFFTPAAVRTLWEIRRFCWDEKENKPTDKDDHAMECLYRAVLDEPIWVGNETNHNSPVAELTIDKPELEMESLVFKED